MAGLSSNDPALVDPIDEAKWWLKTSDPEAAVRSAARVVSVAEYDDDDDVPFDVPGEKKNKKREPLPHIELTDEEREGLVGRDELVQAKRAKVLKPRKGAPPYHKLFDQAYADYARVGIDGLAIAYLLKHPMNRESALKNTNAGIDDIAWATRAKGGDTWDTTSEKFAEEMEEFTHGLFSEEDAWRAIENVVSAFGRKKGEAAAHLRYLIKEGSGHLTDSLLDEESNLTAMALREQEARIASETSCNARIERAKTKAHNACMRARSVIRIDPGTLKKQKGQFGGVSRMLRTLEGANVKDRRSKLEMSVFPRAQLAILSRLDSQGLDAGDVIEGKDIGELLAIEYEFEGTSYQHNFKPGSARLYAIGNGRFLMAGVKWTKSRGFTS